MNLRPFVLLLAILPVVLQPVLASAEEDAASEVPKKVEEPSWTPELSLQYQRIRGTALASDGSRIAYVTRRPVTEGEKSEYVDRIHVAAADGSFDVPYTHEDRSSTSPAFSPDGQYLAFISKKDGDKEAKPQIWVMRVTGGEANPVSEAKAGVGAFRWSPDGRHLAYLMADPKSEEEEKAEKEKRDVYLVHQEFKYSHLYVIPFEADEHGERESRRITEGDLHVTDFDVSPDGERFVVAHQPDPRLNTSFFEGDLSLVPFDGGEPVPLVEQPGVDGSPVFSPDGRHVAFTSQGGQPEPVGLSDVYVVEATAGSTPRRLAETPDRGASLLGWGADGGVVLAVEGRGMTSQILALALDGASVRDLSAFVGEVGAASLSRDGEHLAFSYETVDEPSEVYGAAVGDFMPRRLSSIHEDLPRPPMGSTERLTWTSKDEKFEIEGLLTLPVGYEEGQKAPLILQVHGGPGGRFGRYFTGGTGIYPTQVFAEAGYAVLRPNPRGSSGYGKTFRYANIRDWGYGDYEDLMGGVDLAVERGIADPERLFVMGWSYGGYMTSFVVTRTERFQAASMGAGLPNLTSMVHTTDIGDYLVAHMGGEELWEDEDVYRKHSAIFRLDRVVTPTQILHGAQDLRVPFDQGREFFIALERLGVPTEMVAYPRTPHGPREPKLTMDVPRRILTWFARYGGPAWEEDQKDVETEDGDEDDGPSTG